MRLLLVCHEFPPIGGGGGRATQALAERLAVDHDVTVITARGHEAPASSDGRYAIVLVGARRSSVFGASPLEMLSFAIAATRAAGGLHIDACIAVQTIPAGCVARWLSMWRGVPYVIRLVGADVPGFLPERYGRVEWFLRWVATQVWPRARAVVANSEGLKALADDVARPLGVTVDVVPNGVDANVFQPRVEAREPGPVRFVFVGRLTRQKGLGELLDAVTRQRAALEGRATVEIIGTGEDVGALRDTIAARQLGPMVTLTPWLPRDGILAHLRAADVFVLPSLNEGMPNALLEAMACGLPAVVTRIAGSAELVEDGVSGFVVPARDADALASALVKAVDLGVDRLRPFGVAARRHALARSWQGTADAYRSLLDARVPARRMKRVLLICHEYPPIGGGAATVAASLARALAEAHEVSVITSRIAGIPGIEHHGNLTVRHVRTLRRAVYGASPLEMLVFSLSALATAVRLCREERFDGCIALQGIPAAWISMPIRTLFGIPYLIALVGADVPGFLPERFDRLHRLIGWLTRMTWRRATALLANSDSLRAVAERTAHRIGRHVDTVLYGVDTELHRPPAAPRDDHPVRFLFVGRLSTQKGIRYLIEATTLAHDALRGNAHIVVVGDGEDRAGLEARARTAGLGDVVTFRGWLSREELADCYRDASVFVLPSLDEGRSQAALEAMACGLAVIATAIEGNTGLVDEGVNGFVVPPRDAPALAKALVGMLELGPRRLAEMRDASRTRVARFSWRDTADRYVRYLEAGR